NAEGTADNDCPDDVKKDNPGDLGGSCEAAFRLATACGHPSTPNSARRLHERLRGETSSLVEGRQFCAVVGHEDGKKTSRLGRTCVLADEVLAAGRFEKGFACHVDLGWPARGVLGPDGTRKDVSEHASGMVMLFRFSARRIGDDHGG